MEVTKFKGGNSIMKVYFWTSSNVVLLLIEARDGFSASAPHPSGGRSRKDVSMKIWLLTRNGTER